MKTIVVTGMDGAGKTTLIQALSKSFETLKIASIHLPYSPFVLPALRISGANTPFGDSWTDRLIFALDNRLTAYKIRALAAGGEHDLLLMQRGWMDSFIHGATQGFTYKEMAYLSGVKDLPTPSCSIYLDCDPVVAYGRIKDDDDADKFETPEFLQTQHLETQRFYNSIGGDQTLNTLFTEPHFYLDTTHMTRESVKSEVVRFLQIQNILS